MKSSSKSLEAVFSETFLKRFRKLPISIKKYVR